MDLMTLAKGQEFDIYRMVKERVRFKRSYNDVISALNKKFVREVVARPGWWATVIMATDTCISICNDVTTGNMERSRNVCYLYLQNFKGEWIDNVRSSYLVRKIQDEYDDPTIDWAHVHFERERGEEHPDGDVWNFINYCETGLLEIWDYYWEDRIYVRQNDLFFPSFDAGDHLNMESFSEMGMDRWRMCCSD